MKSICFSSNSVILESSLSSRKTQILLALGPSCRMSSIYPSLLLWGVLDLPS